MLGLPATCAQGHSTGPIARRDPPRGSLRLADLSNARDSSVDLVRFERACERGDTRLLGCGGVTSSAGASHHSIAIEAGTFLGTPGRESAFPGRRDWDRPFLG
jgi:hypothetical protein